MAGKDLVPDVPEIHALTLKQETLQGQRRINLIWELTQAMLAVFIIGTCMVIFVLQAITETPTEFPPTLSNMAFSILAFFLARSNHQTIGGVGRKPSQPYIGR